MVRRLAGLLVALVLGITGAVVVSSPAQAAVVTFAVTNQWTTGYVGEFTVTNNTPTAITGWGIVYDLAPTTTVSTMWNGTQVATTPHFVIIATTWNGTIAPGGFVKVGIVATGVDLPVVL